MTRMKYFCEGLTPDIIKRAEIEIGETDEIKRRTLQELKSCIEDESDLHSCMDDSFLLRFLRKNKFDVSNAFRQLQRYYTFKAHHSGVITDLTPSDVKHILEDNYSIILEYRDQNDIGVAFARIGQYDINKVTPEKLLAACLIGFEVGVTVEASQILGYSAIFDFTNFTVAKVAYYGKPSFLYKLVTALQDCVPGRIKAYHIVNEPIYFTLFFNIMKPFISKKLRKRIYFHGSNLKSLHDHITPDILPEELGGKKKFSEYEKNFCERILSYEDHFVKLNKYGYNCDTFL